MDEMKMHKLMYFAQREFLVYNSNPLFEGEFFGWKYGPVLKEVRSEYHKGSATAFSAGIGSVPESTKELLHKVLERYGSLSSWKLSSLSHEEFSWKKARIGLASGEDGNVKISLNAMKIDVTRELVSRRIASKNKFSRI